MMASVGSHVKYFADRHTAAMAMAFVFYVCIITWCGHTGTLEVERRTAAVAHQRSTVDASSTGGLVFSTAAVAQSVSVACLRLTEADAEMLQGGPLDSAHSKIEGQRQFLSLISRWQFFFPVGDFTLISAPPRLATSGILAEWIAKLTTAYSSCVFASLVGGSGPKARDHGAQMLNLPSTWQSHRHALMSEQHQNSLRVLRLDTLPSPEGLREAEVVVAAASGNSSNEGPLFVFVSEDATQEWSTAVDAAGLKRPPTEHWRSGNSTMNAWEEMLQAASMPQAPIRGAGPAVVVSPPEAVHPRSRFRHDVMQQRAKRGQGPQTAMTDVTQYIPRLAAHLAYTYGAPYVIFASWCSSAGTYSWNTTKASGTTSEAQAFTYVLCLHGSELVELMLSRQRITRIIQP
ncbi:hypothetical protein JKF63_06508 [Porcisia hertigi]|uniref:Uncharacterized protein n=1 Tax=Porcisia hertigi TaxID=2761500 RepID=A0A836LCZ5_9TRYP|nr:hypothetical protein JKF63_06508 [Porcisia hertigi]